MKKTDLSESLIEEKKKDSEDEENASGSKHTTLKVKLSQVLSEEERTTTTTLEKKYRFSLSIFSKSNTHTHTNKHRYTMNLMTLQFKDKKVEREYREFLFEERNPREFKRLDMAEMCSWFSNMIFVYVFATFLIWILALANKFMFHFERGGTEVTERQAPFNLILNVSIVPWQLTQGLVFLLLFSLFVSAKIPWLRSRLLANGARFGMLFGTLIIVCTGWCLIVAYYFGWGISGTAIGEDVIGISLFTYSLSLTHKHTYTYTKHSPSDDYVRVCA